jgi:heme-degrading monooxygenase HmoA
VHVTVTRSKGSPEQPIELATFAAEAMLPWLRQIQGFEGLLMLSNQAEGTTLALTFWESREVAEEHREARMQVRERVAATVDVQIEEVVGYEVSFAHIESPLYEPKDGDR